MNDDDDEENLVFSFFFIAFALLITAFVVIGMGLIIWSFL